MMFNSKGLNNSKGMLLYNSFLHLLFPSRCLDCNIELLPEEHGICVFCQAGLEGITLPVERPPHLRMDSVEIYALFYYKKQGVSQSLLHAMKYNQGRTLCKVWGSVFAQHLSSCSVESLGCLIPVPLHPKKNFLRGYNQSELIAKGILAEFPHVHLNTRCIRRVNHTKSQTKKNRNARLLDVSSAFELIPEQLSAYQHVGLVDDVVTTGATLMGIINLLRTRLPHIRITIFVLAVTK
jgi:competence protein ComFC